MMSFEPDSLNILIVDDTSANLKTLAAILSERGYQVRPCINGEIALNAVQKKLPDLILLDIRMPGIDGYEVCRRLKEDQKTRDVPVIFISALDEAMDKVKAFELGGVDYITKPFQSEEVLARVKTHLSLRQMQARLEHQNTQLQQANAKLKELDRLKSQFLANMSHELRTPLNSIIGFTGIMLQGIVGELKDEQKKQLNMVYESAKHLLGLINDILDLSKIEAGKIEVIPSQFEVKELIHTVEKMVLPLIEEKRLGMEVIISEDVPPNICSDKNRIKQVLINLLSNAIKYTESGKISLTVNADFEMRSAELRGEEKELAIQFSVADTGIGIEPGHLPDVFDEFKQIESPLKGKTAGIGLGLAICKKIVEIMRGRIWAESEYGKGSCFQFIIPIEEIKAAKRPTVIPPETLDLSKKLILTIDDEYETQEILKTYLESEGYGVIQAYNAIEAMVLIRKYHPFAITLDIVMPGKDGWDILEELKEDPQLREIPVICISTSDNRELGLALGVFEYLVKPIEKDQFINELKRLEKHLSMIS